jgi:uncharacterized membrane protein
LLKVCDSIGGQIPDKLQDVALLLSMRLPLNRISLDEALLRLAQSEVLVKSVTSSHKETQTNDVHNFDGADDVHIFMSNKRLCSEELQQQANKISFIKAQYVHHVMHQQDTLF